MLNLKLKHKSFGFSGEPAYVEVNSSSKQLYAFVMTWTGQTFEPILHFIDEEGEPECRLEVDYKIQKIPK